MASLIRSGFGALSLINDLLIRVPESNLIKQRVVFFGGDIQDVERSMRDRESKRDYLHWSLEATAEILANKFGSHALVIVVRPSEYYLDVFSVFRNFVKCDEHSSPIYEMSTNKAWRQMDRIMEKVQTDLVAEKRGFGGLGNTFDSLPVSLVGFSKGCAVLNQMLHEFVFIQEKPMDNRCDLKTPGVVENMFWLDGGHNGESDTWVTDAAVLKAFSDFYKGKLMKLFVHVTPYQMDDPNRPKIRRHKLKFCEIVKQLGMTLHDETHFRDQKRSIETHFEVLTSF